MAATRKAELARIAVPPDRNTWRPFRGWTGLKVFTIASPSWNFSSENARSWRNRRKTQMLGFSFCKKINKECNLTVSAAFSSKQGTPLLSLLRSANSNVDPSHLMVTAIVSSNKVERLKVEKKIPKG